MRQWTCIFIFAAVAAVDLAVPVSAQKQGQQFISLTTPEGTPFERLKVEEVSITEDGMECNTVKVTPDTFTKKLQANIFNHGITTHVLLNTGSQGGVAGGGQIDLGMNITKFSGGRYVSFNGATRLATLLPEIGKAVARSAALQKMQYRVTYERP